MRTHRIMKVTEDADEGGWCVAPYKPMVPFAQGLGWWKCGRCGFNNDPGLEHYDPDQCAYCQTVRDE